MSIKRNPILVITFLLITLCSSEDTNTNNVLENSEPNQEESIQEISTPEEAKTSLQEEIDKIIQEFP